MGFINQHNLLEHHSVGVIHGLTQVETVVALSDCYIIARIANLPAKTYTWLSWLIMVGEVCLLVDIDVVECQMVLTPLTGGYHFVKMSMVKNSVFPATELDKVSKSLKN